MRRKIRVVGAMIEQDGRYLITQRPSTASLPLLWEFPGGRVEEAETDEQALARFAASVDVVTCVSVVTQLRERAAVLRELLRVLRPGGVLVLTFHGHHAGAEGLLYQWAYALREHYGVCVGPAHPLALF